MLNKLQAMHAFSILGMNANLNVWVACAEAGAIPILVELLRNGRAEDKGAAAGSLQFIAVDNQSAIVEAGGIPPLVELLRSDTDFVEGKANAACALRFLAISPISGPRSSWPAPSLRWSSSSAADPSEASRRPSMRSRPLDLTGSPPSPPPRSRPRRRSPRRRPRRPGPRSSPSLRRPPWHPPVFLEVYDEEEANGGLGGRGLLWEGGGPAAARRRGAATQIDVNLVACLVTSTRRRRHNMMLAC